jgi:hypothetical protein
MNTEKKKPFDIKRLNEFCDLVNKGTSPTMALQIMRAAKHYYPALKTANIFWVTREGYYKALDKVTEKQYMIFSQERKKVNAERNDKYYSHLNKKKAYINYTNQTKAFNYRNEKKLSIVQRIIKSLFNL